MKNKILALLVSISLMLPCCNVVLPLCIVYAADSNASNAAYRMEPLKQKLAALGEKDIDAATGRFSDLGKHWSREYAGKLAAIEIISTLSVMVMCFCLIAIGCHCRESCNQLNTLPQNIFK